MKAMVKLFLYKLTDLDSLFWIIVMYPVYSNDMMAKFLLDHPIIACLWIAITWDKHPILIVYKDKKITTIKGWKNIKGNYDKFYKERHINY